MKSADISSVTEQTNHSEYPHSECKFDGHKFWFTEISSGDYDLRRDNSTIVISITGTANSNGTYGTPKPFLKIDGAVMYVACPYYDGTNWDTTIYRFTSYNAYSTHTGIGNNNYYEPLDVFEYDGNIVVPMFRPDLSAVVFEYTATGSGTFTSAYSPSIDLTDYDTKRVIGGWHDGSGNWYYVVNDDSKTYLKVYTFYDGSGTEITSYTIAQSNLIHNDNDTYVQWLRYYNSTFFFVDEGDVYRGKLDVTDSYSKILTGDAAGFYIDDDNNIAGITLLKGTDAYFYKMFDGGGILRYETTKDSVSSISACSVYGFKYDTSYVTEAFSTYTPLQKEWLHEFQFKSPTYEIHTAESYDTYLHLYDDSYNPYFLGQLSKVQTDANDTLTRLTYDSIIKADLNRRMTTSYTDETLLDIVTGVLQDGGVILHAGSIADTGSYSIVMNNTKLIEFFKYIYSKTKQLPVWDADGTVTFEDGLTDSTVDVTVSNILTPLQYREESLEYGSVILIGDGITVQAAVDQGGDDVYYDSYPYIDSVSELQTIADNVAEMQFNQFKKIDVLVNDCGYLTIGHYVDVLYTTGNLDIDSTYIISGFDYLPNSNSAMVHLSNALYIEVEGDKEAQIERNTAQIDTDISTHSSEDDAHHDPVTIAAGSSSILSLAAQELSIDETAIDHDNLANFASNEHFTEASIDHTNLQNIGTNTHAQIDSHIADNDKHFEDLSGFDTGDLSEGANLYYTAARVESVITDELVDGQSIDNAIDSLISTHASDNDAHHDPVSIAAGSSSILSLATQELSIDETAIDHDNLANFASNEHFTQDSITTVGTIGTGVWQGSVIQDTYIANDITLDNLNQITTLDANSNLDMNGFYIFDSTENYVEVYDYLKIRDPLTGGYAKSVLTLDSEGEIGGYAGLDSLGKLPTSYVPAFLFGNPQGAWDADGGYPAGSHEKGDYYVCNDGATIDGIDYEIADIIIWNGAEWQKIDTYHSDLSAYEIHTSFLGANTSVIKDCQVRGKYWWEIVGVEEWGVQSDWKTNPPDNWDVLGDGTDEEWDSIGMDDTLLDGIDRYLKMIPSNYGSTIEREFSDLSTYHIDLIIYVPSTGFDITQNATWSMKIGGSTLLTIKNNGGTGDTYCILDTNHAITNDTWHKFSFSYDGTTVKYYIDDVYVGSDTYNDANAKVEFYSIGYGAYEPIIRIAGLGCDQANTGYVPFSLDHDPLTGVFQLDDISISEILDASAGFEDSDEKLMTAALIKDWVDAHTWDASDIVSGTLNSARIPDLSGVYATISHDNDQHSENYITDYTVTEADVTAHESALTITETQISDLGDYLPLSAGSGNPLTGDLYLDATNRIGDGVADVDGIRITTAEDWVEIGCRNTSWCHYETGSSSGHYFYENVSVNNLISRGTIEAANGTSINEFSTDESLTGDSDNAVPTEQAVKAYVDNNKLQYQDIGELYTSASTASDTAWSHRFVAYESWTKMTLCYYRIYNAGDFRAEISLYDSDVGTAKSDDLLDSQIETLEVNDSSQEVKRHTFTLDTSLTKGYLHRIKIEAPLDYEGQDCRIVGGWLHN